MHTMFLVYAAKTVRKEDKFLWLNTRIFKQSVFQWMDQDRPPHEIFMVDFMYHIFNSVFMVYGLRANINFFFIFLVVTLYWQLSITDHRLNGTWRSQTYECCGYYTIDLHWIFRGISYVNWFNLIQTEAAANYLINL